MTDPVTARTRYYDIDLLRLASALMVVLYHYTYVSGRDGYAAGLEFQTYSSWSHYLYIGINFFFVISGFVILMSARDREPGRFFVSRFTRLMPAYWFGVLATSLAIILFRQDGFSVGWSQVLVNLTMLQTGFGVEHVDGVYWTLWLELKFYAVILLLCALGWLRYIRHLLLIVLLLSVWALSVPYEQQVRTWGNPFEVAFPNWWGYFACGCTFYLCRRDGVGGYNGLLLGLSVVFVLLQNVVFGRIMGMWFDEPFTPWILAAANLAFLCLFALLVFSGDNPLRRPWFLALGALTYPLYLMHQLIGYQWFNLMRDRMNHELLLWGTIALMLGASWLVHRNIEQTMRPLLKRKLENLSWLRAASAPSP